MCIDNNNLIFQENVGYYCERKLKTFWVFHHLFVCNY